MYNVISIGGSFTIGSCAGNDSRCSSTSCGPDATGLACTGCESETSPGRARCNGPAREERPGGPVSGTTTSVTLPRSAPRSRSLGSPRLEQERTRCFGALVSRFKESLG